MYDNKYKKIYTTFKNNDSYVVNLLPVLKSLDNVKYF